MKLKEKIKNFRFRDHLFIIFGLVAFLILLLVGNMFVSSAEDFKKYADDKASNIQASTVSSMQSVQNTQFVEVHNPNAVRINYAPEKITDQASVTGDFKLSTMPGDSMDDSSPEYYQQRIISDKAFIENWIKPAFSYSNLDDYFEHREIMKERFADVDVSSGSSSDFLLYIMPPADDLKMLPADKKEAYNGSMNYFNQYVLDADVLEAPYTFKYFATFTMKSYATDNAGNKTDSASSTNFSDSTAPNYCVVYTITRTADGYPELQSIYFTSIMSKAGD